MKKKVSEIRVSIRLFYQQSYS